MKRVLFALIFALVAAAGPVQAQSTEETFQDGVRAYARGDYETAWFRFRTLAEKGDPRAQFNIGQLYREGRGVPADPAQAAEWYRKAGRQNHAQAQYNLGYLYEVGQGVRKDLLEARRWYAFAAQHGFPLAVGAVERIDRQLR